MIKLMLFPFGYVNQVSLKRQRPTTVSLQRQEVPQVHLTVKEVNLSIINLHSVL